MWKWDQGRMLYFQYDVLRTMASFIVNYDFKQSDPNFIRQETGLPFSAPVTHSPWRNYSRIYKLCLLVSESNGMALPTDMARILSKPGAVTCDEYIHFLVEATTDPSPALSDWSNLESIRNRRNPLCFSLKYILAKVAGFNECITPINEIIGAYVSSGFSGDEDDSSFLSLMSNRDRYPDLVVGVDCRQARESIKFISQISYLHNMGSDIIVSLNKEDAHEIFHSLSPISGVCETDGNAEIQRLASFFRDGSEHDFFDYKGTIVSDVLESGFVEGNKVKKTHVVIERNSQLRNFYFERYPSPICDSCLLDTSKKYPWVNRLLDLHHILPLSSGTRVDSRTGTILDDMVPLCPTCHRAIHRYYDEYLRFKNKSDFENKEEANEIYLQAKQRVVRDGCYV